MVKSSKNCAVCGDKAFNCNFNAVTCESCKAFFRRNAGKQKMLECEFSGACAVTQKTRRFCAGCRLKKCFKVGMKKELITKSPRMVTDLLMKDSGSLSPCSSVEVQNLEIDASKSDSNTSETDPSYLLQDLGNANELVIASLSDLTEDILSNNSINQGERISVPVGLFLNLVKRMVSKRDACCTCCPHARSASSPAATVDKCVGTDFVETDGLMFAVPPVASIPVNGFLPFTNPFENEQFLDVNTEGVKEDSSLHNVLDTAINSEFSAIPGAREAASFMTNDCHLLDPYERQKLDELLIANEVMTEPVQKFGADLRHMEKPSLMDVINLTDIAFRRIIRMCKRISGFKCLPQEDQIALLKGGCTEMMILRGVMSYDAEKESWHGPMSQYIKIDVLKNFSSSIYEEHKKFISLFRPSWRTNVRLMLILGAITLFSPTRPNLIHGEKVTEELKIYSDLLKHFLTSVYGENEDIQVYTSLMLNLEKLHHLNRKTYMMLNDVNPKDVEPLLIEIFDLK